jgi:uncharacterized protein (TIGR01777 family)
MAQAEMGDLMHKGTVVLAGGSGFLGTMLARELTARAYDVVILTRTPGTSTESIKQVAWDGKTVGAWAALLKGAEAVVNLTGKSVNCRYTAQNRREIVESRVNSVNAIAEALSACASPPRSWIQAGSLAIYGNAGDQACDESSSPGSGFSVETCKRWENAFGAADLPQTRKVLLRIGLALGREGVLVATLSRLTKYFLGGAAGTGRQYISWLHIQDLNEMFLWAIERRDVVGTFNATGPCPVTNSDFMRAMRRALNRPWTPSVPPWAVHLGARLMGTESELILTGRRCVPKRFAEIGFPFRFPDLESALSDLFQ